MPATSETGFDPRSFLRDLTSKPGVYCMYGSEDQLLYVGKAKNLKRRVSSYFNNADKGLRIAQMVARIARIEITVTQSEDQALILESELIKKRKPHYNVIFRDDKSYPWLRFSAAQAPRMSLHRGRQHSSETYFGPYPSAGAVRETISTLQRAFQLRTCADSEFANRSRPCLLHQIKRCTAPCTGEISLADYQQDVDAARALLAGEGEQVVVRMQQRMDAAAEALEFERAASLRDRLASLRRLQEERVITDARGEFDVLCVGQRHGLLGVALMPVRGGRSLGVSSHFPRGARGANEPEVLEQFLSQYYLARRPPPELILSQPVEDADALMMALARQHGRQVRVHAKVLRGSRKRLQQMTMESLQTSLLARLAEGETAQGRYLALQARLGLDKVPTRMECFDISHMQGEATRASCVVFGAEGPDKSQYRRFAIDGIEPGDDYAAIEQAVKRRYQRIAKAEVPLPDVLFIDGGKGQLGRAVAALEEVGLADALTVVGISKGPERRPGEEGLHQPGAAAPMVLAADDPALHLIQQIRDEAHRFALAGHRGQRARSRQRSALEDINGLGAKRRSALLKSFGGLAQIRRASADELAKVDGVSRTLAQRVYDHLHDAN